MNPAEASSEDDADAEYEALLRFLYTCPHGMAQFAADGTVLMLNPAFSCLVMPLLPPGTMFSNLLDALAPCAPELRRLLRDDQPARGTLCDGLRLHLGPAPDGRDPRVLSLTVVRMDADRHMAVLSDISAQVANERRLRESDAWFAALVQGANDYAMLGLDPEGRVSEWNSSGERLFGYAAASALGASAAGLVTPAERGGNSQDALLERLAVSLRDGWHLDDGWRARADGSRFWGTCIVSALPEGEGGSTRFLMVVRDTTERRSTAEELRRALTTDHLTGALNRRAFFEQGIDLVRRARDSAGSAAVLMVDVDHFKRVNDCHGHAAGDEALRTVARALRDALPEGGLLCRLGGEEFGVLLPGADIETGAKVAEQLRRQVAGTPAQKGETVLVLTASFGLATLTPDASTLEKLLADADAALYRAKRDGRNRVCVAGAEAPVTRVRAAS
ncbi:sensor domain-containing diguanylate cyclase [Roseomonas nepalensis]|uniref:diguanylate cyclase n=1 Tax=Muricoccus nepalensis TaxID=1854500 RepID=A0A502FIV7_9PROT|nr:sensor domain-containing diguanylate cyclase [Roseomonas nepalensis]TPG49324.1 sensor domain-containing diguanylate cyclase [Roseomonas nepalensis]